MLLEKMESDDFDTSAISDLARRDRLEIARQRKTCSLIIYEIGNFFWREAKLLKRIEC